MEFLKPVRQQFGDLSPSWFMSDDAEQYFNAWRGVFGDNGTKKLLCAWHVDRAWRDALAKHVEDKEQWVSSSKTSSDADRGITVPDISTAVFNTPLKPITLDSTYILIHTTVPV